MIRNAIIRLLGGTPPPEKTCRRRGPLPGGGYQPQPRCGKCEECLARHPLSTIACPRPPEDHWEIKLLFQYRHKPPKEMIANLVVPVGVDITEDVTHMVANYAALSDVLDCHLVSTTKTTTYPPKER